jgi:hypothetical protein
VACSLPLGVRPHFLTDGVSRKEIMRAWRCSLVIAGLTASASLASCGQELPTVAQFVQSLEVVEGPVRVYLDPEEGQTFLHLEDPSDPLVHIVALSSGLDWPIDTGAMPSDGAAGLLHFVRSGNIVRLSWEGAPGQQRAGTGSLPIVARDSSTFLVDATALFNRDAYNVIRDLEEVGVSATFNAENSQIVWPLSTESVLSTNLDVRTTFAVAGGSRWVEVRSANPETLTVVQRHMLLPAPSGFVPRTAPEGSGFIASPPKPDDRAADSRSGWIQRWRLGPSGASPTDGVRTLKVFIGESVPEEHRAAVREGIDYWAETFVESGLPARIQVEDLPRGADPLALEYPVVFMWSQRRQPLASQGHIAVDPRSGEALKAIVLLDALSPSVARNEYRAYRSALAPGAPGETVYVAARLSWVTAHEAGHVLAGLLHTGFRGTAVGFQVPQLAAMHGRVTVDLSPMLPTDPLPYDLWSVRYAYGHWTAYPEDSLRALLNGRAARGLRYIAYENGRLMPAATSRIGGAHVVDALREAAAARSILLDNFGLSALDPDEPRARLYERLVPVYFHHRFALEGVARVVAGLRYGPDGETLRVIPAAQQWEALELLVDMLAPAALEIPERVIRAMPSMPRSPGSLVLRGESDQAGIFRFQTGDSYPIDLAGEPAAPFAAHAWAQSLAEITIGAMLAPIRISRLDTQADDDAYLPTLTGVMEWVIDRIWWPTPEPTPQGRQLQRIVRRVLIDHLVGLMGEDTLSPRARSTLETQLAAFRDRLSVEGIDDPEQAGFIREVIQALDEATG